MNATKIFNPEVKPYRQGFAIFSGEHRLTSKYKTSELAAKFLEKNFSFLHFWANSAGACIANTAIEQSKKFA